jgi:hypothetical protein
VNTGDITNLEAPVSLSFNAIIPVEKYNNRVLVAPFLNAPVTENPFTQKTREYPVDMIYSSQMNYNSEIVIPENLRVVQIPEELSIDNANFTLTYTIQQMGSGRIFVEASYQFHKPVYPAKMYNGLKFYYNKIIDKLNEKIVLEIVE